MRYGSRKVGVSQSGSGESPRVGFSLEAELLLETELLNDIGDFDKKVAKLNCARIDYARKLDLLRRKVMKARGKRL